MMSISFINPLTKDKTLNQSIKEAEAELLDKLCLQSYEGPAGLPPSGMGSEGGLVWSRSHLNRDFHVGALRSGIMICQTRRGALHTSLLPRNPWSECPCCSGCSLVKVIWGQRQCERCWARFPETTHWCRGGEARMLGDVKCTRCNLIPSSLMHGNRKQGPIAFLPFLPLHRASSGNGWSSY